MKLIPRIFLIVVLTIISGLYIFPWDHYGIAAPSWVKPYKYGLDLHGGVELDYKIDLAELKENNQKDSANAVNEATVVDTLKTIIDKRVNSLGLAEPTIQTANYGGESHIIVQIPTQDYGNISEEEKKKKSAEDIARAKETIGKVVQLEFREEKTEITEQDRAERKKIAESALLEMNTDSLANVGSKYRDKYENVGFLVSTGALPVEARFDGYEKITQFPHKSGVVKTFTNERYGTGADGTLTKIGDPGYAIVELYDVISASGATEKEYSYGLIFVDERPSVWMPAKTADGKILNDKYLNRAGVSFSQAGQPQVDLIFNDEGKKIFAELTKRLLGKQIAIFVGGQLVTAPTVQSVIPDGRAVITGNYTIAGAKDLANQITTGIVPAPIYLTSERTIDAKIGKNALEEILFAGLIGLGAIVFFLTVFYRVSGLLAGVALVIYSLLLVAIVKSFGIVLTLASIAGVILSIGLAIDANILIFERMKEALREGLPLEKATIIGFGKSWTAIWDSHITSFSSALILYIFGISLIKGFGLMLGLGILLSLFTAMWVSRILIIAVGRTPLGQDTTTFVGLEK